MRTAYEIVRRAAEEAMSRHALDPRRLAQTLGCGENSVYKVLREEPVRLDQRVYFDLFALAGVLDLRGLKMRKDVGE